MFCEYGLCHAVHAPLPVAVLTPHDSNTTNTKYTTNKQTKDITIEYMDNNVLWLSDFSSAFQKMSEVGYSNTSLVCVGSSCDGSTFSAADSEDGVDAGLIVGIVLAVLIGVGAAVFAYTKRDAISDKLGTLKSQRGPDVDVKAAPMPRTHKVHHAAAPHSAPARFHQHGQPPDK